jgi:hypothetical protein
LLYLGRMQEINISHLVVNGCSFTYCDGLEDPSTQGWPALLANKLGVPVVNLAWGGSGNDRIYRKTVDYFFKDFGSDPFYIIGMSSSSRREEYDRHIGDFFHINLVDSYGYPDRWRKKLEEILVSNLDPTVLAVKKLNLWLSIINLFKSTNTNYLITDMIGIGHPLDAETRKLHPKLYDYVINDPNHVASTRHLPLSTLRCGHDDAVSQILIAEYMYSELTNRYSVSTTSSDHLKVKDFYTEIEMRLASNNRSAWIK